MKSFLNFTGKLSVTRNEESFELVPVELEKGSKGTYPGLDLKTFDLDRFIVWQCKNVDTSNDETLKFNSFNSKIVDLFNELVFLPTWKAVVDSTAKEYDPKKKEAKPDIKVDDKAREAFNKAFVDSIKDYFDGVTKQREKNSVYYKNEAMRLAKLASKEENIEKKKALKVQANEALTMSKQLEAQENKALDDIMLGLEDTESDDKD